VQNCSAARGAGGENKKSQQKIPATRSLSGHQMGLPKGDSSTTVRRH
jgi:hypothetical protein